MPLRLYNTRTRSVEPFEPIEPGHVRIYVCGLTPSAEAHLGHARSFMFFDVLRRWLTHAGHRVTYVQNVTDIDDRSIAAAVERGVPWYDVVEGFLASFKRSMTRLHVLEPDHEPRATRYVGDIVATIERLVAAGAAYVAPDGVYFSVSSFPRYGALSGRRTDELLVGARIAPGEGKRDPLDFALWKLAKPGEPAWPSPWGDGRPGWHIECSAMSHALLGEPFDIHGGGFDLIFPHHENEIAQTESLAPPPMANVWVHGGLLLFDGRKMSKSLGNFEPLATLLDRHDPQAIRFLFLQAGYRKPMNFTEASIEGATTGLRRLQAAYDLLRHAPASEAAEHADEAGSALRTASERFRAALDDDLNTSGAVSALFDLAAKAAPLASGGRASEAAAFLHEAMALLGISPVERTRAVPAAEATLVAADVLDGLGDHAAALADYRITGPTEPAVDPARAAALRARVGELAGGGVATVRADAAVHAAVAAAVLAIVERQRAKLRRDFAAADAVREALRGAGVELKDAKGSVAWTVAG